MKAERLGMDTEESAALTRKSSIALGICVIALMFLMETAVAHQRLPNAASPLIWSLLGLVAAGSLACFFWYRAKARRVQG